MEMQLEVKVHVEVDSDGSIRSAVIDQDDLQEQVTAEIVGAQEYAAEMDADSQADR